jgi:ribosome-associated heat shock protein Hsp15
LSRGARKPAADNLEAPSRRLDQWLWFARLVKSRSLAARLVCEGVVALNGAVAQKPNRAVRIGDEIALSQGGLRRTVRVLALGARRGPANEARALYRDSAPPLRLPRLPAEWVPLLMEEGEEYLPRPAAAGRGSG